MRANPSWHKLTLHTPSHTQTATLSGKDLWNWFTNVQSGACAFKSPLDSGARRLAVRVYATKKAKSILLASYPPAIHRARLRGMGNYHAREESLSQGLYLGQRKGNFRQHSPNLPCLSLTPAPPQHMPMHL